MAQVQCPNCGGYELTKSYGTPNRSVGWAAAFIFSILLGFITFGAAWIVTYVLTRNAPVIGYKCLLCGYEWQTAEYEREQRESDARRQAMLNRPAVAKQQKQETLQQASIQQYNWGLIAPLLLGGIWGAIFTAFHIMNYPINIEQTVFLGGLFLSCVPSIYIVYKIEGSRWSSRVFFALVIYLIGFVLGLRMATYVYNPLGFRLRYLL